MTTILITLLIIAIASAFVCGAEVQKRKAKQILEENIGLEFDNKHLNRSLQQCESALIKQTNEHKNNIAPTGRRIPIKRNGSQTSGRLSNRRTGGGRVEKDFRNRTDSGRWTEHTGL